MSAQDAETGRLVYVNCPRCLGRGYQPQARKPSKRNPNGLGFYARTCPRCRGSGAEKMFAEPVRDAALAPRPAAQEPTP